MNTTHSPTAKQAAPPVAKPDWNGSDLRPELPTDSDVLARDWPRHRDAVSMKWDALTDEDLDAISGSRVTLIERLYQRYRRTPEESVGEVDEWIRHLADIPTN